METMIISPTPSRLSLNWRSNKIESATKLSRLVDSGPVTLEYSTKAQSRHVAQKARDDTVTVQNQGSHHTGAMQNSHTQTKV
jgi:hypothetical protein